MTLDRARLNIGNISRIVIATMFLILMIFPLLWILGGSFKFSNHVFTVPPTMFPRSPTLSNFVDLLQRPIPFQVFFFNSAVVSALHVAGALLLSSMMGYALAKYRFPLNKFLFGLVLMGMLVPIQVLFIPMFLVARDIGIVNTRVALFLPFIAHPLGAFLFRQYMLGVPDSIIESGRIDGASEFRIYLQLFSPMVGPAFAAFAVVDFVEVWNGFVWPLVVLSTQRLFTLPIWLNALIQDPYQHNVAALFAAALITALPAIILFVAFQGKFISGFTITSDK